MIYSVGVLGCDFIVQCLRLLLLTLGPVILGQQKPRVSSDLDAVPIQAIVVFLNAILEILGALIALGSLGNIERCAASAVNVGILFDHCLKTLGRFRGAPFLVGNLI